METYSNHNNAKPKHWLVEVSFKNTNHLAKNNNSTVIYYEEVNALDAYTAKRVGYAQFSNRCRYTPSLRKIMRANNLTELNCYISDLITLD